MQTDGMAPLYAEIFSADAVVIGTVVFMFQITGQTKTFIDRLFALLLRLTASTRRVPGLLAYRSKFLLTTRLK